MEEQPWIGRSLGRRYKIEALLGRGGMSTVYKATDPKLKRPVAVKIIHPHLSTDNDFIRRFKAEAAAIAAFRHPSIVQVYDFDYDGENYFMVMEYIGGGSIQEFLKNSKISNTEMPPDQAVRITISVCDALAYAHQKGMIHRDIKPANIMLTTDEQPILMDFGLVKILNATSHTASGAIIGTARYMPPEIINNESPDERSDIYSLGITFYELLSNSPPFNANSTLTLMMMHLNDPVPDLTSLRPDMPPGVMRIINKALEKDRKNRYSSAEEMAGDLRRLLSTLETVSVSKAEFGYLDIKLPNGDEKEFGISKSEITVGRGQGNDIVIDDAKVSRLHARFEFDARGKVQVIDTGSTNGVRVNGIMVKEKVIKAGDVIQIGRSQIKFRNLKEDVGMTIVE